MSLPLNNMLILAFKHASILYTCKRLYNLVWENQCVGYFADINLILLGDSTTFYKTVGKEKHFSGVFL